MQESAAREDSGMMAYFDRVAAMERQEMPMSMKQEAEYDSRDREEEIWWQQREAERGRWKVASAPRQVRL